MGAGGSAGEGVGEDDRLFSDEGLNSLRSAVENGRQDAHATILKTLANFLRGSSHFSMGNVAKNRFSV
jgi:hypothetical protein